MRRLPDFKTKFLSISELDNYSDKDKFYCSAVVFSPETENNHGSGCPPYIELNHVNPHDGEEPIYFKVPEIVAYYAKTHPCYTMKGSEERKQQGRRELANDIKRLLDIK